MSGEPAPTGSRGPAPPAPDAQGPTVRHRARQALVAEMPAVLRHVVDAAWDRVTGSGRPVTRPGDPIDVIESADVGVPVRVAYDRWMQADRFPAFDGTAAGRERAADPGTEQPAPVFWSPGEWRLTFAEQVPDERVVWRARSDAGEVDGTASFHELTPDLTRVMVVLAYRPQGLAERLGQLCSPPDRRVRHELRCFVRGIMTESILDPDAVRGWRGEIRAGRVVQDDESAPG